MVFVELDPGVILLVDVYLLLGLLGVFAVLQLGGRLLTGEESLLDSGLFVGQRGELGLEAVHASVVLEHEVIDILILPLEDVLEDPPEEVLPGVGLVVDLGDGGLLHGE